MVKAVLESEFQLHHLLAGSAWASLTFRYTLEVKLLMEGDDLEQEAADSNNSICEHQTRHFTVTTSFNPQYS